MKNDLRYERELIVGTLETFVDFSQLFPLQPQTHGELIEIIINFIITHDTGQSLQLPFSMQPANNQVIKLLDAYTKGYNFLSTRVSPIEYRMLVLSYFREQEKFYKQKAEIVEKLALSSDNEFDTTFMQLVIEPNITEKRNEIQASLSNQYLGIINNATSEESPYELEQVIKKINAQKAIALQEQLNAWIENAKQEWKAMVKYRRVDDNEKQILLTQYINHKQEELEKDIKIASANQLSKQKAHKERSVELHFLIENGILTFEESKEFSYEFLDTLKHHYINAQETIEAVNATPERLAEANSLQEYIEMLFIIAREYYTDRYLQGIKELAGVSANYIPELLTDNVQNLLQNGIITFAQVGSPLMYKLNEFMELEANEQATFLHEHLHLSEDLFDSLLEVIDNIFTTDYNIELLEEISSLANGQKLFQIVLEETCHNLTLEEFQKLLHSQKITTSNPILLCHLLLSANSSLSKKEFKQFNTCFTITLEKLVRRLNVDDFTYLLQFEIILENPKLFKQLLYLRNNTLEYNHFKQLLLNFHVQNSVNLMTPLLLSVQNLSTIPESLKERLYEKALCNWGRDYNIVSLFQEKGILQNPLLKKLLNLHANKLSGDMYGTLLKLPIIKQNLAAFKQIAKAGRDKLDIKDIEHMLTTSSFQDHPKLMVQLLIAAKDEWRNSGRLEVKCRQVANGLKDYNFYNLLLLLKEEVVYKNPRILKEFCSAAFYKLGSEIFDLFDLKEIFSLRMVTALGTIALIFSAIEIGIDESTTSFIHLSTTAINQLLNSITSVIIENYISPTALWEAALNTANNVTAVPRWF